MANKDNYFVANKEDTTQPVFNTMEAVGNKILNTARPKNQKRVPETPIDTAHLILENSELTGLMPEIDKEMKLGNLDQQEKISGYQFLSVWNDLEYIKVQQLKKIKELQMRKSKYKISDTDLMLDELEQEIKELNGTVFDSAGALRKAMITFTLSRGKDGFEREKQVETIQNYKMESIDKSEKMPSFMERIRGGLRR